MIDESKRAAEADLLARLRAGDQSAWRQLLAECEPKVYRFVLAYCHDRQEAEELTSQTFVRAHLGIERFRGDASLSTWLTMIGKNLARNRFHYWRRRQKRSHVGFDSPLEFGGTLGDHIPAGGEGPRETAELADESRKIAAGIAKLNARDRAIVELRMRGLSYEEISIAQGVELGTVKSRVARARERLRAYCST